MSIDERWLRDRGYQIDGDRAMPHATKTALTSPDEEGMPEGSLLARIRALASQHGYLTYHTHDSRKSELGFPDLVLCNGRRLLMYELKTRTGKLTMEQWRWLSLLEHTGIVECGVWRPQDLAQIPDVLKRKPA